MKFQMKKLTCLHFIERDAGDDISVAAMLDEMTRRRVSRVLNGFKYDNKQIEERVFPSCRNDVARECRRLCQTTVQNALKIVIKPTTLQADR